MEIIMITTLCAAIGVLLMAKKSTNKWRQMSLSHVSKKAVNLQRSGDMIRPAIIHMGKAICLNEWFDISRLIVGPDTNGFIPGTQDVLIVEDDNPDKTAIMMTSRPLIRYFTELAADAEDQGANTVDKTLKGSGFQGVVYTIEMETEKFYKLKKGDGKFSPYTASEWDPTVGECEE